MRIESVEVENLSRAIEDAADRTKRVPLNAEVLAK
jgi:hypothetical protein